MREILYLILLLPAPVFTTCNKGSNSTEDKSETGSSHNTGKNCQGCHSLKATSLAYNQSFTSVYNGATIEFTSAHYGVGNLLVTLTSDRSGNFYTNSSVNFGSGVFASITVLEGSM